VIALTGQQRPGWRGDSALMDFYDLKGILDAPLGDPYVRDVRLEPGITRRTGTLRLGSAGGDPPAAWASCISCCARTICLLRLADCELGLSRCIHWC
jgi:hypothetical protein